MRRRAKENDMIRSSSRTAFISFAVALATVGSSDAATICVEASTPGCSSTIQAGIDAAAPGDTVQIASGTYFENVGIPSGLNGLILTGAGSSKTIIDGATPAGGGDVLTIASSNVTVSKLGVRNGDKGIAAAGITGLTLEDIALQGLHDDCVNYQGDSLTVRGSLFRGCGGNGISVVGNGLTVSKSTVRHTSDTALQVQGNNALIKGNSFQLIANAISVTGNLNQVIGNKISDAYGIAIDAQCLACTAGLLSKNKIKDLADDADGIDVFADAPGLIVESNSVLRTANAGLNISGVGVVARKNKVSSVGGDASEQCIVVSGDSATLTKNKVSLCAQDGFAIFGATNTLEGNSAAKAFANGFRVSGVGDTLTGNKAKGNLGTGFVTTSSASNTSLVGNKATKNRTDLCDEGSLTTLTDNNFATTTGGCGIQ